MESSEGSGTDCTLSTLVSEKPDDFELDVSLSATATGTSGFGDPATGLKQSDPHHQSGHQQIKTTVVFCVLIAAVWVVHTLPIAVFYVPVSQESSQSTDNGSSCTPGNGTTTNTSSRSGITNSTFTCSEDFYVDTNTGLCKPECGKWNQYPQSTKAVVYGLNITFLCLTILVDSANLVLAFIRRKQMFRFPNIILVYIVITRIILLLICLTAYTDEKALYCTSRDVVESFENGSPFCTIIGVAATYLTGQALILACFHLAMVLFGAYFPFHARHFDARGRGRYVHIAAIVLSITLPSLTVGIQFAMGGYTRTMVPIYCLADLSSAFYFSVIPGCLLSAIFLTLVMLIFLKITRTGGWMRVTNKWFTRSVTGGPKQKHSNVYTTAQIKLALTFCAYGFFTLTSYTTYSIVLQREEAYSIELDRYFDCESTGTSPVKMCDRSTFESLDPTEFTFPFSTITQLLWPTATLMYIINFQELKKKCSYRLK